MTTPTADKPVRDERISPVLFRNPILGDFCSRYLASIDEIAEYNTEVLAAKDADWTPTKVMEKARELGRPTSGEANESIKSALIAFEEAATALNLARRSVLDATAKELGITLSATAERNSETEAPLKEKHKFAAVIGTQLKAISDMTTDEKSKAEVAAFLEANPLPAVGRDQARSFGADEKTTPKYRVTVVVKNNNGEEVLREDGFTKAALSLTKIYPRGEAPKADKLRLMWENAGNSAENPAAVPVVEFNDEKANLHYTLTKK